MRIASRCALLALVLTGAASAASPPLYTDAANAIVVQRGSQFSIGLSANKTTGYSWTLHATGTAGITRVSETYAEDVQGTSLVGAGGVQTFTFRAMTPGKATMRFDYLRPWEHNVPPVRTSIFRVTVQ